MPTRALQPRHYAADASPSDTAKGITGGVGMLAGGAIDTVSQRQHLASPDVGTRARRVISSSTPPARLRAPAKPRPPCGPHVPAHPPRFQGKQGGILQPPPFWCGG